jgi:hypothetical protein
MNCESGSTRMKITQRLAEYQRARQYEVIDADGKSHGSFDTLDEAVGAADFDRLTDYEIYCPEVPVCKGHRVHKPAAHSVG